MAGINYKKRKRNDTILPQLFKECEILYDKFNKDLLAGKLLSLSDTAILQHYLGDDGCKLSIQKMAEMRLKLLKDPEIVILVAGEYNAGKTTFVNILMGGDYLPMGRGKKSRTVCEIRHSMQRQAIISYTDREKEIVSLTSNCKDECWKRIQDIIKTDYTNEDHGVTRVVIEWPIKVMKGFLLTNFNDDDDISNERTEASPPRFPSDFIDQLNQCLSKTHHQHEETGLPSAKFDSSQTYRKEVYSGLQNDPTDDSEPRMELLKEASENSTEKGNEEASLSSNSEQETPDKETVIDQTTPKQIIDTSYDNFSDVLQDIEQFTFSFVDCPGIDSSEPESFKPSREEMMRCFTFFFIIDESQDDGFHKKGIQTFTQDVDKSFKDRKIDLRTDQMLFFANKMDIATEETQEYDVITELHDKVKQTWGLVKRSQIIPLEARKTLKGTLSKSLKQTIQDHISSCTWIWLEEQYIWLLNCLNVAYHLSLCTKPPTAMKNALAEPLKKAKTAVYEVQDELKDISEAAVNEKAWADLKSILLTVGNLDDISWREMEVKTEVQKRIGGDRETNVDWLVLYNIICEMICEQVVMKINALGDDKKNKLYQAQSTLRKSIYKMFEAQNDKLKEAQNMLPSFQGSNQDAASNDILTSMVAPLLASLSIRGAHIFLPYFLLAAPAVPVFLVARSVWEEWNYSNQEARREEFLRDRVAFMRKETSQILTYSKRDVNENVKISKSVLFRFIYREIDERYRLHERSEALLEMVKYLENFGDKPSDALYVNVTLRTAVTYYIEQVLDHDILPEDITGDINADQRNPIGNCDGQSKVFDASLNGTIGFAVKEFRIDRANDSPDVMLGYRQCYFLRKLSNSDSDRLVKFYGTYIVKTDTDLSLRIVLKRYDGSLKDITERPIPRDPRERLREFQHYAKECSECVKFLHDNSTVHEDIKPTNFLLTRQPNSYDKVCITDIGGVKSLEELQFSQAGATKGARRYLAPEITTSNTGHSKASDIYCLGLVLWELWHRKSSYENIQVINNIEELTALSDELPKRSFIGSLQRNPCHRENIDTLLKIIDELKL